jgi:hypothetical protein
VPEIDMLRTIAILVAAFLSAGAQVEQSFPHTKKQGRSEVEYRHEGLTFVANYDYSQRNHRGPWLLIDVALGSNTRFVLHRDHFTLGTPDGRTVKLATQEQVTADGPGLTSLIQNAKIYRQNLDGYFPQRNVREPIGFYSIPFVRTVSNEAIVDNDRVTAGPLLFKSPTGSWDSGTYRLALENERAQAALPIALQ